MATIVGRDHPEMTIDDIVELFEEHLAETESAPVQDFRLLLAERRVRATLTARAAAHAQGPHEVDQRRG